MTSASVDLGSGHRFTRFSKYSDADSTWAGIIVYHPLRPDDRVCVWRGECVGSVTFDLLVNAGDTVPKWQVLKLDPLTLSPSLACHCGDHGFIRDGRWTDS